MPELQQVFCCKLPAITLAVVKNWPSGEKVVMSISYCFLIGTVPGQPANSNLIESTEYGLHEPLYNGHSGPKFTNHCREVAAVERFQ